MRTRTVELSWSGERVPAIADELRRSPKTVRRWLHGFNSSGLDGLKDLGGQGRRRRIRSRMLRSHRPDQTAATGSADGAGGR
ncbi:helix-turn-helix domain-containing protein [Streptomyces sp. NBC_00631]|uniref:helix-turn-helix domain-containing protein n=1 Tax=Streptomyces sp. NBC_00631 TaxID=2975793 RepID=UPI0030DE5267